MLRSLRSLTALFLALFLIATSVGGITLYISTRTTLSRLADQEITSVSELVAPRDAHVSAEQIDQRIRRLIDQRDTGSLGFILIDASGRTVIANVRPARIPPSGYSTLTRTDGISGLDHGRALTRDLPGGMKLTTLTETEPFEQYFTLRGRTYLAIFGGIIGVVLLGLVLFHRLIAGRMKAMRGTVEAIIDGDLSQRVPQTGANDAFETMAAGFNHMLDRIQSLMDQVTHISSDVAHEMRSPLSRLRTRLKALEQTAEAEPVRETLSQAIADADQALSLMAAILRIAEIESGKRRSSFAPVQLDLLAAEIVQMLTPLAEEAGLSLSLTVDLNEALPILGDHQLLAQLLINLIENAIRHAQGASRIDVRVSSGPELALMTVEDDGPGMKEADRALAMRRFGRLERSRTSSGYGLGLALVGAIARLHHGGSVELGDARPGLRVIVTLPRTA